MFAIAVAAIMLAAGFFVIANTDDSEATNMSPTVNVYYYINGDNPGWGCVSKTAYNLYEAVYDANVNYQYGTVTAASSSWTDGTNPNRDYGLITGIGSLQNFTIMAYDGSNWVDVTNCPLGWIRPFVDYGAIVSVPNCPLSASANVAIVVGNEDVDEIDSQIGLSTVYGYSNTLYKFTIKDSTGDLTFTNLPVRTFVGGVLTTVYISASDIQTTNGFDVYGYGSDAYLALIDAVGANLVSENMSNNKILAWQSHVNANNVTYYTYYSWMGTLFGAGTESDITEDDSTYWYWMLSAPNNPYLSYNFGYYSQLSGCYMNVGDTFYLTYYTETW